MAAAFKLKGNEAFKAGDYVAAIGAYTSAMMADQKDATFPLNRAAAYLKLNKFQDAERDCGNVLAIESKNIKALFRRAQARAGLENYQGSIDDWNTLLRIEPGNQTAKQELAKTEGLLTEQIKKKKSKPAPKDVAPPAAPYRRRVPIEIVEDENAPLSLLKQASAPANASEKGKKPLVEEITQDASASTSTTPKTFQEARQVRTARTARTVGGGIIKRDGSNSDAIFQAKAIVPEQSNKESAKAVNDVAGSSKQPLPKPANAFEFQRQWRANEDAGIRWDILQNIPPEGIPAFFKSSMESPLLSSIFSILQTAVSQKLGGRELVGAYARNLQRLPRFETLTLFFSNEERRTMEETIAIVP